MMNDFRISLKKFWIECRKRQSSRLNGKSLLYRWITSFKHLGEHFRAKIIDFKISLKQL